MTRKGWRDQILSLGACLWATAAVADGPACVPNAPICSIDQLVQMPPQALDALYQQGTACAAPSGKIRGTTLFRSGTALAGPSSKVNRLVWQGKVFDPCGATVVNKFFGMRAIKGNVYQGESWMDGRPSLIIDYQETSRLYANYRDEIRQVGPGVYLGLMYARTCPQPTFKMYFALECRP